MQKSPEALRIYFSGPAALKFLESNELTVHEAKVIEAAMATARTANPDLDLLHKADAIVHRISHPTAEEPRQPLQPAGSSSESSLAALSSGMPDPKELEPDRRTLLGYLLWRERRRELRRIYAPVIVLVLILFAFLVIRYIPGVKERIDVSPASPTSSARYKEALEHCERLGRQLPASVDELKEHLGSIPDYKAKTGYWLGDGRVFYPDSDKIRTRDKLLHWVICVE